MIGENFLKILLKWLWAVLSHCGLVTPYADLELGQLRLREWLVAW